MNDARPRFLTPADVAKILRVNVATVYKLLEAKEIQSTRVGHHLIRITPAALEAYIKKQTQ
jgi:excisionase family DNA binding protein